jgi:spermidine/putrescine-binding protein
MNLFVSAKKFVLHLTVLLFVFCSFALTVPSVVLASQTSFVTAQYTVADATSDSFSNAEILDLIDGQISDLRLEKEKIAQEVASYGKQVKGTTDLKIDAAKAKLKDINAQINALIAESKSLVGK